MRVCASGRDKCTRRKRQSFGRWSCKRGLAVVWCLIGAGPRSKPSPVELRLTWLLLRRIGRHATSDRGGHPLAALGERALLGDRAGTSRWLSDFLGSLDLVLGAFAYGIWNV